jgi:ABC-type uncharacterized transport system permease subunit
MLELPIVEKSIFYSVLIVYLLAALVGFLQLSGADKYRRILISLIAFGVSLESVILVFRAAAIKAVPLTGLFESMIVLTIVFGLTYLFLSIMIKQVWFSSVMSWIIFVMAILSAAVARPASQLQDIARTPWVIVHGLSMALSGAMISFATAMAILFLLCRQRLKNKQVMKVVGKIPNIEKLEHMNLFGLKACFVFMTFGLVSGIGMAVLKSDTLQISIYDWLTDSKIIIITAAWILVGMILTFRHTLALKGKSIAQITMLAFFLILFAIIGASVFCGSAHDFGSNETPETIELKE